MTRKKVKRSEKDNLKHLIWLKCAECQGFWIDSYAVCPNQKCPLRKIYPPRRVVESRAFKEQMAFLARQQKNDEDFLVKILPPLNQVKKTKKMPTKKRSTKK